MSGRPTQADIEKLEVQVSNLCNENAHLKSQHDALLEKYGTIETALQLLAGNINSLRTELLVVKAIIEEQACD